MVGRGGSIPPTGADKFLKCLIMEERKIDVSKLTQAEVKELQRKLREREAQDKIARRDSYEKLRNDFLEETKANLREVAGAVKAFNEWLRGQSEAFFEIYKEYGLLKRDTQQGYSIENRGLGSTFNRRNIRALTKGLIWLQRG